MGGLFSHFRSHFSSHGDETRASSLSSLHTHIYTYMQIYIYMYISNTYILTLFDLQIFLKYRKIKRQGNT